MGDLCEANNSLLAPTGDDFSMVKESERESNDRSRLTYTLEDKMILQQLKGLLHQQITSAYFSRTRNSHGAMYSSHFELP